VPLVRRPLLALAALFLAAGPASFGPCGTGAAVAQAGCCKVCRAGKACGDSCIARDKTCHKGKGCACDA
jgi:hypothetical protein